MLKLNQLIDSNIFSNIRIKDKIFFLLAFFIILSTFCIGYFIYLKTSEMMVQTSFTQMSETIKQTTKYINEKLLFTVEQFNLLQRDKQFVDVCRSQNRATYVSDFVKISSMFEGIRMQNMDVIKNIFLYRMDGAVFYEYTSVLNYSLDYEATDWYQATTNNQMLWYKSRRSDIFNEGNVEKVFSITEKVEDGKLKTSYGILVFDLKEKFLRDTLANIDFGENSVIFITDEEENIISSTLEKNAPDFYKQYCQAVKSKQDKKGFFDLPQEGFQVPSMVIYDTIPLNNWRIIALIPKPNLNQQAGLIKKVIVFIAMICCAFFVVFALISSRIISAPLGRLAALMKKVQAGNLEVQFNAKSNDEIGIVGKTFDDMIIDIKKLIAEVREEKEMKVQAELRVLQEQINSHFLYNTLNAIYWTAKSGAGEDAAKMAHALANFFRLALNKGQEITTVEKEIEHIKNYLLIEKLRYKDKFDYIIDIDSQLYPNQIPKLILQPLIENAILHGIYEMEGNGIIQIKGRREEVGFTLEVIDNGVGMDVEKVQVCIHHPERQIEQQKSHGYALLNVYNRLKMKYHDKVNIDFISKKNEGTTIKITFLHSENSIQ